MKHVIAALLMADIKDVVREIKDSKLKRSLLKTLDKAAGPVINYDLRIEQINEALEKRAEPPLVIVDRQRIRRVHFDS